MTLTKVFYIAAVLLLFPVVLFAQKATENSQEATVVSIEDLHIATSNDLLTKDATGTEVLSQEYYNVAAIPDRVAKLIKASLMENTMLAEQTAKAFNSQDRINVVTEEVIPNTDVETSLPTTTLASVGGI